MRSCTEHRFASFDGQELFYRCWQAGSGPSQGNLVLLHRGHEHSGRCQLMVDGLQLENWTVYAWDQRGCGQSPGPRGQATLEQLERDLQAFFEHLAVAPEETVLIAHSLAAVVAGLWAVDYAPRLKGLVLATPALKVKLYVPFAMGGLKLARRLGWLEQVSSYVRGAALTHDREQAQAYDRDPLISKQISTDLLLQMADGSRRLQECAGNLEIPTQVLCARADWVVKNRPIRRFFQRLPSPHKELEVYRDFYHSIFHEKSRHQVFSDVRAFVLRCGHPTPQRQHLLRADRHGATAELHRWHQAGLPWLHPKNWAYRITRWSMGTLGRLSQGIRLGWKTGFSSGASLDYVYENQPRGWTPLGSWLDRIYLDNVGWRYVRLRRQNLQELLQQVWPEQGLVVDIAGGAARYLNEVRRSGPRVLVRDRDSSLEARVRQGSAGSIDFQVGDALDESSLAALGPIQVAIVSGLYELIPDNGPVRASLAGLARAIPAGGYLLYTNQPYHPQLEFIAETLHHGDGRRWVMRCRSTAEMDELVRQAGFTKIKMRIDDQGIFSVSLAQRNPQ